MKFRPCALAALSLASALALGGCASVDASPAGTALESALGMCSTSVEEARSSLEADYAPTTEIATLKTPGRLTVGLRSTAVGPAVFSSSDELSGYYVDFGSALAEELGLKVTFVTVPNIDSSLNDSVDVVLGVRSNESAASTVVAPFEDEATGFFSRGESVSDAASLSGKTVGVQESSSSQRALAATNLEVETKTFSNVNEAFDALENGEVDFVLCDVNSGEFLSTYHDDITLAGALDAPTTEGVAVLNSDQALQAAVTDAYGRLESTGRLGALRERWYGTDVRLSADSQVKGVETTTDTSAATTDDEGVSSSESTRDGSTAGANAAQL